MTVVRSTRRVGAPGSWLRTDVDEVVVDRLLAGDKDLHPTWHELDVAILRLEALGYNGCTVADRLGVTNMTVYRHGISPRRALRVG